MENNDPKFIDSSGLAHTTGVDGVDYPRWNWPHQKPFQRARNAEQQLPLIIYACISCSGSLSCRHRNGAFPALEHLSRCWRCNCCWGFMGCPALHPTARMHYGCIDACYMENASLFVCWLPPTIVCAPITRWMMQWVVMRAPFRICGIGTR